jgi:hypothetical protein
MKNCFPYRTRGSCILGSYCDESDRNGMLLARQVILMSMLMIYFVKVPGDCHGGRATWSVPGRGADKPGMPPCSDRAAPRQLSGGALLCFALRLLRCARERPRAALPPGGGAGASSLPPHKRIATRRWKRVARPWFSSPRCYQRFDLVEVAIERRTLWRFWKR